jgi:hypothetical protein
MTLALTADSLIERARRDAMLASRGAVYTLGSAYTAGATSLVLNETPSHMGMGSVISIDYELFYVKAVSGGTNTITVIPGYFSTTPANHDVDALVEVDARFPKAALLDYAHHEILSWGRQLWRVEGYDLDVDRATRTYDLSIITDDIYFLLDVRLKPVGTVTDFWNFSWTGDAWPHYDARLLRNMATSEFASGNALQFRISPRSGGTVRVVVAHPFDLTALTGATDLVATVGLKPEWFDILELGIRARALSSTVVGRSDWRTGNMSRSAEEVSVFDVMRATQQATQARDIRLADEATDLRGDWPYRGS